MSARASIPWWEFKLSGHERVYLERALAAEYVNEGPLVREFEERIAKAYGVEYAIATTSGTMALYLALRVVDAAEEFRGARPVIPDTTFIATANAVSMGGVQPIISDVDPSTAMLRREDQRRVCIAVHVSGRRIAAPVPGCVFIEDAAECVPPIKLKGIAAAISFSPHKIISTGQGGVVLTNDDDFARHVRAFANQGWARGGGGGGWQPDTIHEDRGVNARMSDVQAAIGIGQLHALLDRQVRCARTRAIYEGRLAFAISPERFRLLPRGEEMAVLWTDAVTPDRDALAAHLAERGIETRKFWRPIHQQPPYRRDDSAFPNATRLAAQALWLPSAYTLTDADVERVCDEIVRFYKRT